MKAFKDIIDKKDNFDFFMEARNKMIMKPCFHQRMRLFISQFWVLIFLWWKWASRDVYSFKGVKCKSVMNFKACWQPGSDKILCPASNWSPLLISCMEILQIMRPLTDPHLIEPTEWDIIVRWSSRYCLHPWLHIIKTGRWWMWHWVSVLLIITIQRWLIRD